MSRIGFLSSSPLSIVLSRDHTHLVAGAHRHLTVVLSEIAGSTGCHREQSKEEQTAVFSTIVRALNVTEHQTYVLKVASKAL